MSILNEHETIKSKNDYIEVWFDSFLKDRKAQGITKGTILFYQLRLNKFISYLDSQQIKYISEITPDNIREFLLLLEQQHHNAGGIAGHYRCISVWMKWYWNELDIETRNPISKVKAPKIPQQNIQGVSKNDFDALVSVCGKNRFYAERNKAILMVLYDTGVRASELCHIDMLDLNINDMSVIIQQGKGRKPRTVFFGVKTRKQLRKYLSLKPSSKGLFVSNQGETIRYSTLRMLMGRLSLKAGIKVVSLHSFRRAFTLNLLNQGVAEITIARLLGHTSTALIGRYANQTTIDLQNGFRSILDRE